jgi:transcriptional regulator with XRE-family HTH domain
MDDLGQRLRRFREERGWTQAALAEHAGVSKPYLSELEGSAGRRPSGQILLQLADALGVTVADLLGRQVVPGSGHPTQPARVRNPEGPTGKRLADARRHPVSG